MKRLITLTPPIARSVIDDQPPLPTNLRETLQRAIHQLVVQTLGDRLLHARHVEHKLHMSELRPGERRIELVPLAVRARIDDGVVYADEGDLQRTLQAAIRVAAYQHNEYAEAAVSKRS